MIGVNKQSQLGMLQGLALGDAYGMPFEMMDWKTIQSKKIKTIKMVDSFEDSVISKNRVAGSVTDDTLNTLMIMEMLKENDGKIDTTGYLKKIIQWKKSSPIAGFVCGPSTSRAIDLIEQGVSPNETGKFGMTNGAAMKIAPLGIVTDWENPEEIIENTTKICRATHNTTIAIQGASIICGCASYLLHGEKDLKKMKVLIDSLIMNAEKSGYLWPTASLQYRIDKALEIADNNSGIILQKKLYDEIGTSMQMIDTIPCVLALFYRCNGDINQFVQYSATIGGDTDTIGAIGGALCGAMHPELIPKNQIIQIEQVNNIKFDSYLL